MIDALRTAELMAWVSEEQRSLWHELDEAIRSAVNGSWSMRASNIARRIVSAARLVGVTEHGAIPYGLEAGGVRAAVLRAGGIEDREPSEEEWQRWDGMMAKYETTRAICRPKFADTVAAINSERESRWIAGEDE